MTEQSKIKAYQKEGSIVIEMPIDDIWKLLKEEEFCLPRLRSKKAMTSYLLDELNNNEAVEYENGYGYHASKMVVDIFEKASEEEADIFKDED